MANVQNEFGGLMLCAIEVVSEEVPTLGNFLLIQAVLSK